MRPSLKNIRHILLALLALTFGSFPLSGCSLPNASSSYYDASWDADLKDGCDACTRGQYGKAAACFQRAIETAEDMSPNDNRVATVACYYGAMQLKRGRLKDAELLYRNALSVDEATMGKDSADAAQVRRSLADVLRREGKYADARQVLAQARSTRRRGKKGPTLIANAHQGKRIWPKLSQQDEQQASQVDLGLSNAGIMGDNNVSQQLNMLRSPIQGGKQELVPQR